VQPGRNSRPGRRMTIVGEPTGSPNPSPHNGGYGGHPEPPVASQTPRLPRTGEFLIPGDVCPVNAQPVDLASDMAAKENTWLLARKCNRILREARGPEPDKALAAIAQAASLPEYCRRTEVVEMVGLFLAMDAGRHLLTLAGRYRYTSEVLLAEVAMEVDLDDPHTVGVFQKLMAQECESLSECTSVSERFLERSRLLPELAAAARGLLQIQSELESAWQVLLDVEPACGGHQEENGAQSSSPGPGGGLSPRGRIERLGHLLRHAASRAAEICDHLVLWEKTTRLRIEERCRSIDGW